jgi:hypothetical protein
MALIDNRNNDEQGDTYFTYNDAKEAILDLFKYNTYRTTNDEDIHNEISIYFKNKYDINLFYSTDKEVYNAIFGDFEK